MPAFEKEEYEFRISKVRKSMDEKNIEVLIVTDPSNMAWLTGYDDWSFYVHQCVVLSLEGEPFWFSLFFVALKGKNRNHSALRPE